GVIPTVFIHPGKYLQFIYASNILILCIANDIWGMRGGGGGILGHNEIEEIGNNITLCGNKGIDQDRKTHRYEINMARPLCCQNLFHVWYNKTNSKNSTQHVTNLAQYEYILIMFLLLNLLLNFHYI
ncbi:hypothetical protein ACJX0J_037765, partial [Zea mays]